MSVAWMAGVGGMEDGCGRHGERVWEAWRTGLGGMEGGCVEAW